MFQIDLKLSSSFHEVSREGFELSGVVSGEQRPRDRRGADDLGRFVALRRPGLPQVVLQARGRFVPVGRREESVHRVREPPAVKPAQRLAELHERDEQAQFTSEDFPDE